MHGDVLEHVEVFWYLSPLLLQDDNDIARHRYEGVASCYYFITVKLVHKIMRVFYSHSFVVQSFVVRCACDTLGVANGGIFCPV